MENGLCITDVTPASTNFLESSWPRSVIPKIGTCRDDSLGGYIAGGGNNTRGHIERRRKWRRRRMHAPWQLTHEWPGLGLALVRSAVDRESGRAGERLSE